MTPTIETRIWMALRAHVSSLPLSLPIMWPGEANELKFDSDGKLLPYIRVGRITVAPVRLLLKGGQPSQRRGTLMLTLVHPVGGPVEVPDDIAGKIAEHFIDGTQVKYQGLCVEITSYPHVMDGYEDVGFWTIPVSIPWECFA